MAYCGHFCCLILALLSYYKTKGNRFINSCVPSGNLGLITNEESVQSTVGPEEAAAFFQEAAAAPATQDTPADDMHDMVGSGGDGEEGQVCVKLIKGESDRKGRYGGQRKGRIK